MAGCFFPYRAPAGAGLPGGSTTIPPGSGRPLRRKMEAGLAIWILSEGENLGRLETEHEPHPALEIAEDSVADLERPVQL